ncbi:MAG: rhodanese-like domain-containing protein [Eubacteriales bacterium]|nr:rhodanese-like domain-containing protein [Eubacteriales bacterium]
MRKLTIFIMLAVIALALTACNGINVASIGTPVEDQEYKSIKADEALELIGQEHVHLIDVRNPDELADGYIKGMVNIRLNDLDAEIGQEVPDKADVVIVYCASGNRSAKAARMLCNAGYKKVFDLGGLGSWPYDIQID